MQLSNAKIAIVHEFSTGYVGSEKVVEQILALFPNADLFFVADFLPPHERHWLKGKTPATTFIQHLPFARKYYKHYLPLMPLAVEGLDLSAYQLIISSSHAVAKGVLTGPDQLHICYCHTPIRYAWDLQHQYLKESGMETGVKRLLSRLLLHYIRVWDARTANGVDLFIANSNYIARRIKKVYGRDSTVIYPPVDVDFFTPPQTHQGREYYLTASRLVPYKRIETIVQAFTQMPDKQLLVIGHGPHFEKCQLLAGPNVRMLGYQSKDQLLHFMQGARAFVFAAEEDFGISVVEAQACGLPVICYARGGATESIIDGETGLFFFAQTADAIIDAVQRFESHPDAFSTRQIRRNSERFGTAVFLRNLSTLIADAYAAKSSQPHPPMTNANALAAGVDAR